MYMWTIYVERDFHDDALDWVFSEEHETTTEAESRASVVLEEFRKKHPEAKMRRSIVPGI